MADQTTSEAVIERMVERAEKAVVPPALDPPGRSVVMGPRTARAVLEAARVSVAIDALQEIAEKGKRYGHLHPCWALAMKAEIALAQLTGGQE